MVLHINLFWLIFTRWLTEEISFIKKDISAHENQWGSFRRKKKINDFVLLLL